MPHADVVELPGALRRKVGVARPAEHAVTWVAAVSARASATALAPRLVQGWELVQRQAGVELASARAAGSAC